jgi:2-polyprenyl-3-methyl-5-hydroxy-6-metoxy-1,4-benzoquinol methylase
MNNVLPDRVMAGEDSPSLETASQLERLRAYFSASAREWQELYQRPRRVNDLVLAERRELAVAMIRELVAAGGRVLDAGCGAGLVGLDLAEQGYFVHGVDIAEPMLELSRRRFREAGIADERREFSCGELLSVELPRGSFDAIVALGFLEYQVDEAPLLARFRELLRPGGTLVVSGPTEIRIANYLGLSTRLRAELEQRGLVERVQRGYGLGLHRYDPERFHALLGAAGLELVRCHGHGFVEFEGPLRRLPYAGERALHRLFTRLSGVLPLGRYGNDLLALGRKPR